jgi:hypothetical protein
MKRDAEETRLAGAVAKEAATSSSAILLVGELTAQQGPQAVMMPPWARGTRPRNHMAGRTGSGTAAVVGGRSP